MLLSPAVKRPLGNGLMSTRLFSGAVWRLLSLRSINDRRRVEFSLLYLWIGRPNTVKYEDFQDVAKSDQFGKAPVQNDDAFLHGVVCKAKVSARCVVALFNRAMS